MKAIKIGIYTYCKNKDYISGLCVIMSQLLVMSTIWGAWNPKLEIILLAECIFVLKTSCDFQQHIYQEQPILRQIKNLARKLEYVTQWKLNPTLFQKIVEKFGKPNIDLFATGINQQLDRYLSWHQEQEAMAINAFSLTWDNNYFYMFPHLLVL